MEKKFKLLIIDDFQISALGTKAILNEYSNEFEIFTAFSYEHAMEVMKNIKIDIILSDILMPDNDGFVVLKSIKSLYPDTKLMFFTISDDKETIYKAIKYGADGFQFKYISKQELVDSLKTLLEGKIFFHRNIMNVLWEDIRKLAFTRLDENDILNEKNQVNQKNIDSAINDIKQLDSIKDLLTSREIEIIEQIGMDKSTAEIAETLNISAYTVSTHRKNINGKLGIEKLSDMKRIAKQLLNLKEIQ